MSPHDGRGSTAIAGHKDDIAQRKYGFAKPKAGFSSRQSKCQPFPCYRLYILSSKILRIWMPDTISDILGHIRTNGLLDVVLNAVPLEDHGFSRTWRCLSRGSLEYSKHYNPVSFEICDLSLVIPSEESGDPDTLSRRQHDQVYCKYLQQCAKRQLSNFLDSRTRCSLAWYETRLCELSDASMKQR